MKLLFERSTPGHRHTLMPEPVVSAPALPEALRRTARPHLPEISEIELGRHYTELAKQTHGVNDGFYPLGSCTMKYNPRVNEGTASLPGFTDIHPLQPASTVQGALAVLAETAGMLSEICGMDAVTLQPAAGAHGEYTGLLLIRAYHLHRGDTARTKIIVPDSAHGTNPASAVMAGFTVVSVPSNADGGVDLDALRAAVGPDTAGLMLTNPNTLGLFDPNILEICRIIHEAGGLCYYDGANLNAVMGHVRPGDMGFDCVHVNLHKTFSTPHGGGGPGSGPVGVSISLVPYLPTSRVIRRSDGICCLEYNYPESIGYIAPFYGNFGVILRAYAYLLTLGREGLRRVSENAVINANYVASQLEAYYDRKYRRPCMHECVLSGKRQLDANGVHTLDIAKGLIDRGFHPPTIYFPLIVPEAIMIEPTETESKEILDAFIEAMKDIARAAENDPESLHAAPVTTPVRRLDETLAARKPDLKYNGD